MPALRECSQQEPAALPPALCRAAICTPAPACSLAAAPSSRGRGPRAGAWRTGRSGRAAGGSSAAADVHPPGGAGGAGEAGRR